MNPRFLPRAPRLPLRAPITLRTSAAKEWAEGRTLNISCSGVLFTLPAAAEIEDEVELVVNLSRGAMHGPGVALLPDLHYRARVVRCASGPEGEVVVAASIQRQLLRSRQKTPLAVANDHGRVFWATPFRAPK